MLNDKKKLFWVILSSFLLIPLIVSVISSIHVINFFELSNFKGLAIALSVSFEIGALSALAGLIVMDKINKNIIYFIFILLTAYQMMGNTYYAYEMLSQKMAVNPNLINNWTELFGFETDDTILMKRIIAIISGAILPIVSLCFLDLSVDYIKKSTINESDSENFKKKLLAINDDLTQKDVDDIKIVDNSIDKDIILNEEPVVVNDRIEVQPNIEIVDTKEESIIENGTLLNVSPIESNVNDVITEEEKKDIRENNKKSNKINMRPNTGFHNMVYTK